MQISLPIALLGLLAAPALLLGADKVQNALASLESKDASTYEKAAEFLAKHPQEAREPLRKLLQDYEKSPLTRFRAAKLLGDLNDQDSAELMKKTLFSRQEGNAAVRVEIIRALAKLGRKDMIVAYANSGLEKSAPVTAAIALALQGSTDEDSKVVLGRLLSTNDDERVSRAAVFAISKTYSPFLASPQNAAKGKPSGSLKAASSEVKGAPPPPPPSATSEDKAGPAETKKEPSAADKVIFAALKAKAESKNAAIRKQAADLLQELSKAYQQP
jgi:HEAT repeat protein